jgi:hypothetical protein
MVMFTSFVLFRIKSIMTYTYPLNRRFRDKSKLIFLIIK